MIDFSHIGNTNLIDYTNERLERIAEWLQSRNPKQGEIEDIEIRIEKCRKSIERITKGNDKREKRKNEISFRISGGELEIKTIENSFNEIAKNCEIEWFRNKWMKGKSAQKINEIKYWVS